MPLIAKVYDVAGRGVRATHTSWQRVVGGAPEPLFVPSAMLALKGIGDEELTFSEGEISIAQLSSPAAVLMTVVVKKTVDTGATLFTLLLPVAPVLAPPKTSAKIEAVGLTTTIRTPLGNVGGNKPAESSSSVRLVGTYSESDSSLDSSGAA